MIEYAIREYLELITGMDVSPVFTHGPFPAMTYKISPYSEGDSEGVPVGSKSD